MKLINKITVNQNWNIPRWLVNACTHARYHFAGFISDPIVSCTFCFCCLFFIVFNSLINAYCILILGGHTHHTQIDGWHGFYAALPPKTTYTNIQFRIHYEYTILMNKLKMNRNIYHYHCNTFWINHVNAAECCWCVRTTE